MTLVTDEMLPQATKEPYNARSCDIIQRAFTREQIKRMADKAKELASDGGGALVGEMGAISSSVLAWTPSDERGKLAEAGTIAVLLGGIFWGSGQGAIHHADGRGLIEVGVPVALGTDLNPSHCWCESMQLVIALACRYLEMTQAEAIVASTLNAAYAIDLGKEVGSLEVGKKADVLVLDVPNYRHLGYRFGGNLVEKVIKDGVEQRS